MENAYGKKLMKIIKSIRYKDLKLKEMVGPNTTINLVSTVDKPAAFNAGLP